MEHKSLGYGPELHEGARLIQKTLKVAFEKEAPTQMLSQRRRATKNKTAQDESGRERARAGERARASLRVEEAETPPLPPPAHKPTAAPKPIAQVLTLLYWYKSTNTDAEDAACRRPRLFPLPSLSKTRSCQVPTCFTGPKVLASWYTSTNTDT